MVIKERCKGCGLCIQACPQNSLELGTAFNSQGYAYIRRVRNSKCIGCGFCAELCPDVALRVYKEKK